VAAACLDVANEVPVQSPNTFGPIPPLGPDGIHAPSYAESVAIAVDWAVNWTLANPDRPIVIGGYSQGGEAGSRYRQEFELDGRLAHLKANYVCGYAFGNPARHYQHTYYGGPATPFEGIAAWRLPAMGDDWCELVDPGDLYGTCARGLTGEIERDVYTLCTDLQLHDREQFLTDFIANTIELIANLDGDAGAALAAGAARHGVDLSGAQPVNHDGVMRLTDRLLTARGVAAAIAAAVDGLIFFCSPPYPTADHCEYHNREVWPGVSYVGLAIQHVRDYVSRLNAS
jgi:hypothetical protein